MQSSDHMNRIDPQLDPFDNFTATNLIQEMPEFPPTCQGETMCFLNTPICTEFHSQHASVQAYEQKHRHKMEWVQVIRTSLFPILFSMIVVFILIRILFMIHDTDHLLTFLQTILGLFGASASGYAYAQNRFPAGLKEKSETAKPDDSMVHAATNVDSSNGSKINIP